MHAGLPTVARSSYQVHKNDDNCIAAAAVAAWI
jgi:hypothetical protein